MNVGIALSSLLVAFAIIWSQYKQRYLLAHVILALIFAGSFSDLFQTVFALNFGATGFVDTLISAVAFLYALGVVLGELLVSKPKVTTYPMQALFSILV